MGQDWISLCGCIGILAMTLLTYVLGIDGNVLGLVWINVGGFYVSLCRQGSCRFGFHYGRKMLWVSDRYESKWTDISNGFDVSD